MRAHVGQDGPGAVAGGLAANALHQRSAAAVVPLVVGYRGGAIVAYITARKGSVLEKKRSKEETQCCRTIKAVF